MKSLKKLIAFAVSFALVFSAMAVGFAATTPFTDVKDDAPYASAVARLVALDITKGVGDGKFGVDQPVTRAQMVTFVNRMLGYEGLAEMAKAEKSVFKDVPQNHWAVGHINLAYQMGIAKGVGDGKFDPNGQLTYAQALAFVLRALGYHDLSWPYGVLAKAQDIGLTAGINLAYNQVMLRGDLALVLDRALNTPMVKYVDGKETQGDKLISKVANVTKYLVVATPDVDSNVAAGKVQVKGIKEVKDGVITFADATTINAGNIDFNKYLGKVVEVYTVKSTGEPVFVDVTATPEKSFTAKGFEVVNNVVYNDNKKVVEIPSPTDVTVIYNGGKTTLDQVLAKAKVEDGASVTILAPDNKTYNYMIVNDSFKYQNVRVTADVKAGDKFINANSSLRIAGDPVKTVIVKGSVDKVTDIKANDIIYYGTTVDGSKVTILVVRDKVEGKVTTVIDDGAKVVINDKTYTVKGYAENKTPAVGDEGVFVLDKDGNIVYAILKVSAAAENYAIALAAEAYGPLTGGKVELLTAEGKKILDAKFEVADVVAKTYAENKDLITYTVKDNKVDSVKKVEYNVPGASNVTYDPTNKVLGGSLYLSDSTLIFNLKDNSVVKVGDITVKSLNVVGAVEGDYNYLKVLVINSDITTKPESEVKSVVYGYVTDYVKYTVADNKTYYKITALANGGEVTYTSDKDVITATPEKGIVYVFKLDANGVIIKDLEPVNVKDSGKVSDYSNYGIKLENGAQYALDSNVTVVSRDGKLAGLGDIAKGTTTVELYVNSVGKVVIIKITN
ncbi:MAG: trimeric autotransporter adhesin [Caldanaerobacter sp.]|uniref:S-layer homology domain-containing protein n=1 Tax=Caldanaerobacter sp. TaxID=2930036 RepID=UPI0024AA9AAF|nr:S-layer homology domain-containing protein [Caldanaerobacter sp.]MDI3518585.1 trimeric autotransporter adhesin [Caldanaerobacter sp.]